MTDPIMKYFSFEHLPPDLQDVSRPFCQLAGLISKTLPDCDQKTVSLQKLLEAKDAGVRAAMEKPQ
jgi:hypothetical protein